MSIQRSPGQPFGLPEHRLGKLAVVGPEVLGRADVDVADHVLAEPVQGAHLGGAVFEAVDVVGRHRLGVGDLPLQLPEPRQLLGRDPVRRVVVGESGGGRRGGTRQPGDERQTADRGSQRTGEHVVLHLTPGPGPATLPSDPSGRLRKLPASAEATLNSAHESESRPTAREDNVSTIETSAGDQPAIAEATPEDQYGTGQRILVVDDEPNIVDVISMALRFEGFEVDCAAPARRRSPPSPRSARTLIVLDVMLPDIDGFEVARRLGRRARRRADHLPDRPRLDRGQGPRAHDRRRRLRHQAVQPRGAGRAHPHDPAPQRAARGRELDARVRRPRARRGHPRGQPRRARRSS